MSEETQGTLWSDDELRSDEKWNARTIETKILRVKTEILIGSQDFDRLSVDRAVYEERAKRWKGVKKFTYQQNKFEALEARAVIRFLNEWKSRRDNLEDLVVQLELALRRATE